MEGQFGYPGWPSCFSSRIVLGIGECLFDLQILVDQQIEGSKRALFLSCMPTTGEVYDFECGKVLYNRELENTR